MIQDGLQRSIIFRPRKFAQIVCNPPRILETIFLIIVVVNIVFEGALIIIEVCAIMLFKTVVAAALHFETRISTEERVTLRHDLLLVGADLNGSLLDWTNIKPFARSPLLYLSFEGQLLVSLGF